MSGEIESQLKVLRHNYLFNILDGGFFGFALGFASFSTIIPLFVSTLTDSALLIGLIPAMHNIGWQLPQLLTARYVSRLSQLKPSVMLLTIQERLPFIGLTVIALMVPVLGLRTSLIATFVLLAWQGLGGGITANAWQNMIGQVIPGEYRATFYGFQGATANLLASAGVILAGYLLENVPYPRNYALCFGAAVFFMIISYGMINQTIEYPHLVEENSQTSKAFWRQIAVILRDDHNFDWYLATRCLMQFALMGAAFYTVYAVNQLGMSKSTAGIMASVLMMTQVIANPFLGWLADKLSRRAVLALGAASAGLSALIASLAPSYNWFFLVSIFIGLAYTSYWTIGLAITAEFGDDGNRAAYIGLANTIIAPVSLIALLVGGWLADNAGYSTTFVAAAVAGGIAFVVYIIFLRDPAVRRAV